MKFLHAADLHIDSPLRGLERAEGAPVDVIRRAPREAFTKLVDLALAENVDFVVLVGDIFDGSWRDMSTGLFFAKELARLREMPVIITLGNHDADSVMETKLRYGANVRVLDTKAPETVLLEKIGVALHGQSFPTRAVTVDLAATYPQALAGMQNIGLLHTSMSGYAGHDTYAPTTLEVLRSKGYAYWALGHVHAKQILCEDPYVVYPGNIQGRHVGETGEKGCFVVSDAGGALVPEFHALDTLRWSVLPVDVSQAGDSADAARFAGEKLFEAVELEADGRPMCVRVTLVGACGAHRSLMVRRAELEAQLRADGFTRNVWVESLRVATSEPAERTGGDDGLAGALIERITHVREDRDERAALAEQFSPIATKIPPAVAAAFGTRLSDPDMLDAILEEAQAELLARLT